MVGRPGPVVLFGSGETSASGRKVYDWLLGQLPQPTRVAVLETPAGFELNSAQVAGRVADFLRERLQNYHPQVTVVPARRRGTPFSPDDPALLAPLLQAGAIFLGPGSPTYAIRQLRDSLAWSYVLGRHRLGAAVILASAAAIAVSARALPVYEIYKVGEDLGWRAGLDFFGPYGLALAVISHWDNAEGGADLDTSRCYMGRVRFEQLVALLSPEVAVVGIDEHTALVVDLGAETCRVMGLGGVTLLHAGRETRFRSGQTFSVARLGPFQPLPPDTRLPERVWQAALASQAEAEATAVPEAPPPEVLALAAARAAARAHRDWPAADALRARIAALGWQVVDSPEGSRLIPSPAGSRA
ncbi:MAG: cysteinyl-tRNA synthetase [Chloroflexi bacterium]|nr:cysteinyl-tRNA synthetase [Chloroflexota bacterium]